LYFVIKFKLNGVAAAIDISFHRPAAVGSEYLRAYSESIGWQEHIFGQVKFITVQKMEGFLRG